MITGFPKDMKYGACVGCVGGRGCIWVYLKTEGEMEHLALPVDDRLLASHHPCRLIASLAIRHKAITFADVRVMVSLHVCLRDIEFTAHVRATHRRRGAHPDPVPPLRGAGAEARVGHRLSR